MISFWQKLRTRKIVQWALAYLAGAWLVLQLLSLLAQPFAWPDLVLRAAVVLLAVGFFGTLVIAWYHGEKGAQRVTGPELAMIAGILVIAAVGVAFVSRSDQEPRQGADAAGVGAAAFADTANQNSLAVLPFVNLSPDREQEYFSDGLTEELLNMLSRGPGLRVAARTSAFAFKGQQVPIDEIARRLNVEHVLEGSVRRESNRVRISVQLIEAAAGHPVWSETYDRELTGIFAIQEEIGRAIADALHVRLADGGGQRHERPTADPEAYALYLRGRFHFHRYTESDLRQSVEFFRQALARDPGYAAAYAGLSDAYNWLADFVDPREVWPHARQAAQRALELDESLAEAHTALGNVLQWYDYDLPAAERAYRRALKLNPHSVEVHSWYSILLDAQGRIDEAMERARLAQELDPLSVRTGQSIASLLLRRGRAEEALEAARRIVPLDPTSERAHPLIARAYIALDRPAEAVAHLERTLETIRPGHNLRAHLAHALAAAGRHDDARAVASALERDARAEYVPPSTVAIGLAWAGATDGAIDWLERGYRDRDPLMISIYESPYDPLRADPRFQDLLRRLGLD